MLPSLAGVAMADALTVIPAAVLRNLSDKLYEKRKNAALDVCPQPFFIYHVAIRLIWGFRVLGRFPGLLVDYGVIYVCV